MSVTYVDHMGTNLSVVNAARRSYDRSSPFLTEKDVELIRRLGKKNHWTPFAHCSVSLDIEAPIIVARQLAKHQIGLTWSEVSRRYTQDDIKLFRPDQWRLKDGGVYTPGSYDEEDADSILTRAYYAANQAFHTLLEMGIPSEQARIVLPQGMMVNWRWSGSLMAFARVCQQRLSPHAQYETQQVAREISDVCSRLFPHSWGIS